MSSRSSPAPAGEQRKERDREVAHSNIMLAGLCNTPEVPANKPNYRYSQCVPDPSGSGWFIAAPSLPPTPQWSKEDRSSFLPMSPDCLEVGAEKGWRTARVNCPVRTGRVYWEVEISSLPISGRNSHVRIGISRRESNLNAPVGYDGYSYGLKDTTGQGIHMGVSSPSLSDEFYTSDDSQKASKIKSGDVVGVLLTLPDLREPDLDDPLDPAHVERKRIPISFKSLNYFESAEYPHSREMINLMHPLPPPPPPQPPAAPGSRIPGQKTRRAPAAPKFEPLRPLTILPNSKVQFFLNGELLDAAFSDLCDFIPLPASQFTKKTPRGLLTDDGSTGYYPTVSCFGGGRARISSSRDEFKYAPTNFEPWISLSERYDHYKSEVVSGDKEDVAKWIIAKAKATQDELDRVSEEPSINGSEVERDKTLPKGKKRRASDASVGAIGGGSRKSQLMKKRGARDSSPLVLSHLPIKEEEDQQTSNTSSVEQMLHIYSQTKAQEVLTPMSEAEAQALTLRKEKEAEDAQRRKAELERKRNLLNIQKLEQVKARQAQREQEELEMSQSGYSSRREKAQIARLLEETRLMEERKATVQESAV